MPIAHETDIQIEIRPFHQEDAACIQFVVLSVLQEWGFIPSAKDQQELEAMQSCNPFDAFFVADDPEVGVIGCAGIVHYSDDVCELRKIYLLKRFRGQSIGKRLLDTCVEEAKKRNYSKMRLEVHSAMARSAPFYMRNGFVLAEGESVSSTSSVDQVYYKQI